MTRNNPTQTVTEDDARDVTPAQGKRGVYGKPRRPERLGQVLAFGRARARAQCEVACAKRLLVPRSTLRSATAEHVKRVQTQADQFLESPDGQAFLHRLIMSLHVVLTVCNPCGVEQVCQVLRQSGLERWVAPCYGAHKAFNTKLVAVIGAFATEQTAQLGATMPRRRGTLAMDEVFFGQPVLVALEAASGFLLVEKQVKNRDEATWSQAALQGLHGLNIEVVQGVGDEGGALGACIEASLGAQRSTDVFHGQLEMTRGCSAPLRAKQTRAQAEVEQAGKATRKAAAAGPPRPLPEHVVDPADKAYTHYDAAKASLEQATSHRKRFRHAIRGVSGAYHPFDLTTGAARAAGLVEQELRTAHREAEHVAGEAKLCFSAKDKLAKAARLVARMRATVAFFHQTVTAWVTEQVVNVSLQTLLLTVLIPYFYLQQVAMRLPQRARRTTVLATIARLRARLDEPSGLWAQLDLTERQRLQTLAIECADLFVRTSSAVEGRNGRLSLHHHGWHVLPPDKLAALTAIHNFLILRPDGTTAAERFFKQKPPDLFEHLVDVLPMMGRPAARRHRPHRKVLKMAA